MTMYFQIAAERQHQTGLQVEQGRAIRAPPQIAGELGVKEIVYGNYRGRGRFIEITFFSEAVLRRKRFDDNVVADILLTDFDPLRVIKLEKVLEEGPYTIDKGGISSDLKTGVRHLGVKVTTWEQEEKLVYQGRGTYEELRKLGLVTRVGASYEPLSGIVLREAGTTNARGFLGLGKRKTQETIYEARRKTTGHVAAYLAVTSDGSLTVDEKFLQNEDVRMALDAIVEHLFGFHIMPRDPVA